MSCYLDGFGQELHGDLPHGPWAYVFSLTPWQKRKFRGGETILLQEDILSYWQGFKSTRSLEQNEILREVPPLFNRLTVFDPRVPHGVRTIEGVRDLLEGRLVIHGWFVQPRPFVEGPLPSKHLQTLIDELSSNIEQLFNQGLDVQGTISLRFEVSARGLTKNPVVLSNSLRHPGGDTRVEKALLRNIKAFIARAKLPPQKTSSRVTLPLIFEVS